MSRELSELAFSPPPTPWGKRFGRLGILILQAAFVACGGSAGPDDGSSSESPGTEMPYFRDASAEVGLDFVHHNGMSGELYMVEMVGAGVALLDYDLDGDLDIYLVQGHDLPEAGTEPPSDRLYRNDSQADQPNSLAFTDVTEEAGLRVTGYGQGVAVGDIDSDGWPDLFVANFGANQLWRNLGPDSDGVVRFEDVTEPAGIVGERWSSSSSFVDLDGDGWLDLYVTNYLELDLGNPKVCRSLSGLPDYCGPQSYPPVRDTLYRNRGDGTFEDISRQAGVLAESQGGLGVLSGDFDQDGIADLYVANDMKPNFLWHRSDHEDADLTFENLALAAGAAVNRDGKAEASMGVVGGDVDNDGDEEIFITHLSKETHTLYRNEGGLAFDDRTRAIGLSAASVEATGFGTCLVDIDNDGWLDIVVANGEVKTIESLARAGDPYPLHQPNQVFRNTGDGTFEDAGSRAGEIFELSEVSRGLASGDLDNDGDVDLVLTNNNGPARLLLNQVGQDSAWLGVEVLEVRGERATPALGVRVRAELSDGSSLYRWVRMDGSFASSSDPRIVLGLGAPGERSISRLIATWPDGHEMIVDSPSLGSYLKLVRSDEAEGVADGPGEIDGDGKG